MLVFCMDYARNLWQTVVVFILLSSDVYFVFYLHLLIKKVNKLKKNYGFKKRGDCQVDYIFIFVIS